MEHRQAIRLAFSNPKRRPVSFARLKKHLPAPYQTITTWTEADLTQHLQNLDTLYRLMPEEAAVVGALVVNFLAQRRIEELHEQGRRERKRADAVTGA